MASSLWADHWNHMLRVLRRMFGVLSRSITVKVGGADSSFSGFVFPFCISSNQIVTLLYLAFELLLTDRNERSFLFCCTIKFLLVTQFVGRSIHPGNPPNFLPPSHLLPFRHQPPRRLGKQPTSGTHDVTKCFCSGTTLTYHQYERNKMEARPRQSCRCAWFRTK